MSIQKDTIQKQSLVDSSTFFEECNDIVEKYKNIIRTSNELKELIQNIQKEYDQSNKKIINALSRLTMCIKECEITQQKACKIKN